jgi:hypothetical protein
MCREDSTFPLDYQKMPNKNKSRNNSRKSTASSQGKPVAKADDDDFSSIVMKLKPQTSRRTTPVSVKSKSPPTSPRPEFLEPLSPNPITPPPTPWETLGMEEADYHAMMERIKNQYMEDMRKTFMENLYADLQSPSFWLRRIESLEKEREYFNKKRGWSAADIVAVERIDEEIAECQEELEFLDANEENRLEVEYD